MNAMTRLRLAKGLRWKGRTPDINWREAAEVRAELNQAALLACLNGHAPGVYTEDEHGNRTYLVCEKPWELKVAMQ